MGTMCAETRKSKASKATSKCVRSSHLSGVCRVAVLLAIVPCAFAVDPAPSAPRQARIKDISSIEGIRDNQLVGYGIVVGLQGTGDSQRRLSQFKHLRPRFSGRGKAFRHLQLEYKIWPQSLWRQHCYPSRDPALNWISLSLLRVMRGTLRVAWLLMTSFYGADGKIYAQGQGPLVVGGYSVTANGTQNNSTIPRQPESPLEQW